jgi:hypothetical protein
MAEFDFSKYPLQELKKEIIETVQRIGIPKYLNKWHPNRMVVKTPSDLHDMLRAYHQHSRIEGFKHETPPKYVYSQWYKDTGPNSMPKIKLTDDGILRITFYRFVGDLSIAKYKKLSDKMTNLVKKALVGNAKGIGANNNANNAALKPDIKGIILDFRYHTGGNVHTLHSALAPLLRGSTLYGEGNTKATTQWVVMDEDGNVTRGKYGGLKLMVDIPIAVLIGPNTGSSGEFGAAMFYGRPRTRTFGQPTEGSLSSNADAYVSSKHKFGIMYVTSLLTTTLNGKFTEQLTPHCKTNSPVSEAKSWLRSIRT